MIVLYPTDDAVLEIDGSKTEPQGPIAAVDYTPITPGDWDFTSRPFNPDDEIIYVKENTFGFSRRMNPTTRSQSTLQ